MQKDPLMLYEFEELTDLRLPDLPQHPLYAPDFLRIRETIGERLLERNGPPPPPTPASMPSSKSSSVEPANDSGPPSCSYTNGVSQPGPSDVSNN